MLQRYTAISALTIKHRMPTEKPPLHDTPRPVGLTVASITLLTAALWGGTPVAVKYAMVTLPPIAVAAVRFALGALFMIVWCRFERTELRLRSGQFTPALITGVLLFVQIALFNWGIHLSNSSHGSMHINTFIFWVVAIEHFITRADRLNARKLMGLLIAAAGVVLILTVTGTTAEKKDMDDPSLLGDAVLLTSAFVLGIKIVYTKHALKTVEPGKLIFWHDVFGVLFFVAYSLSFETVDPAGFTMPAILGLAYQGIVVTGFCFAVQALLLKRHSASQISVFSFATPLFGVTIAVLMRGDRLSPWLLAAAVCVAAGILLVNLRSARGTTAVDGVET